MTRNLAGGLLIALGIGILCFASGVSAGRARQTPVPQIPQVNVPSDLPTLPDGLYIAGANFSDPRPLFPGRGAEITGFQGGALRLTAQGIAYEWRYAGAEATAWVNGEDRVTVNLLKNTVLRVEWDGTGIRFRRDGVSVLRVGDVLATPTVAYVARTEVRVR